MRAADGLDLDGGIRGSDAADFRIPAQSFLTGNDSETVAAELQSVWRVGQWQLVSGVGYVDQEDDYVEQISVSTTAANVYAYGQWQHPGRDLSC